MTHPEYTTDLAQADRAVFDADRDLRHAVLVIGEGARPRLAQLGVAAVAVGVVGALIVGRGRRSSSRVAKAIDYSVLLPLAASVIPRLVAMFSSPRATVYPASPPIDAARSRR